MDELIVCSLTFHSSLALTAGKQVCKTYHGVCYYLVAPQL